MPRYYILNNLLGLEPKQSSAKEIRVFGVKRPNDLAERSLVGTGIAFVHSTSAADTITDSGNGLGSFKVDDFIRAEGTASNDGVAWRIITVAAGTLTLHKNEIVTTETAGDSFTLSVVSPIQEAGQQLIISQAARRLTRLYPFLSDRKTDVEILYNDDLAGIRSIVSLQEGVVVMPPDDYAG